jgi:alpha-ketoglutaric semialdehyde dehydrogenase
LEPTGKFFVASRASSGSDTFRALDASTGATLDPPFFVAGVADADHACAAAWDAFSVFRDTNLEERAAFLEAIAENIEGIGDALIVRAMTETGLPRQRLEGERLRTVNQLRFFADVVRGGRWLGLRTDTAQPERTPPRPDLHLRKIPVGPVAVFGASNFPLAFSVAGGDTAAAFAAGCPVVVKGHPAHPGVSELVARAIGRAVADRALPPGVFSFLAGPDHELGRALVANPHIKAVGFTGSRAAGLELCAVAAARPEPIPVYAEMSSVNPVFLLPGALQECAEDIARDFVSSVTLGAGQFCTNPGLVFAAESPDLERFLAAAAEALAACAAQTMLTSDILQAYENGIARLARTSGVERRAEGPDTDDPCRGRAALFVTDAETFKADARLGREVFGPVSVLVRVGDPEALIAAVDTLEGQLTASVHMRTTDIALASRLIPLLEQKAGRIIANGWPTGVEVSHAMVHGGPFPATSDSRTTSVGSLAIERFLRPVCYQNVPQALLPETLRDIDTGIERLVDGARVGPDVARQS